MTIHLPSSGMQCRIDELEKEVENLKGSLYVMSRGYSRLQDECDELSCRIQDGISIITDYLEDEMKADDTDLAEWAESGPMVSVARVQRNAIVELADHMEKHGNTYRGEVIRQWAISKLGLKL